eukprot:COSAG06_NODE_250_length_19080_cov_6.483029_12_plen_98_part_00
MEKTKQNKTKQNKSHLFHLLRMLLSKVGRLANIVLQVVQHRSLQEFRVAQLRVRACHRAGDVPTACKTIQGKTRQRKNNDPLLIQSLYICPEPVLVK